MNHTNEQELRKAIVNYRVLCDVALSERDDEFYTQEEYENAINGRLEGVVKLITDWHNKLIRTGRLKLLAEVRERVVGDFEKLDMGGSKEAVSRHNIAYDRNWLRIEQMSALNKLEAEL